MGEGTPPQERSRLRETVVRPAERRVMVQNNLDGCSTFAEHRPEPRQLFATAIAYGASSKANLRTSGICHEKVDLVFLHFKSKRKPFVPEARPHRGKDG